ARAGGLDEAEMARATGAELGAEAGGAWRFVRAELVAPRLAPVLERFAAAWNAGARDELLALAEPDPPSLARKLESAGAFEGNRPRLAERRVEVGGIVERQLGLARRSGGAQPTSIEAGFRIPDGEVVTHWIASEAGLVLVDVQCWRFSGG
ncbi:MAG TPA: hypothetical protein VF530_06840, partial [Planctomycetota bacterium]